MSLPIQLELDPKAGFLVRLGWIKAEPIQVRQSDDALEQEIQALCSKLLQEYVGKSPAEIPGLASARELYRSFGVDPTRTRPSSEALLRRVLKGKPYPKISNAVDFCNLCSLRFLLPLGLYDVDQIQGKVTLRRGRPGESYPGIRKDEVHVKGRMVLADELGPFGNPSSDSFRTAVTEDTRSIWMVIFAPKSFSEQRLRHYVDFAKEGAQKYLAPKENQTQVVARME